MLITLSATSSVCFGAKKFASWLFMMTHNAIYLSNLIGATTWHYARIITPQFYQWRCPDPIFRQGRRARAKNLVSGDETTPVLAYLHRYRIGLVILLVLPITSVCLCLTVCYGQEKTCHLHPTLHFGCSYHLYSSHRFLPFWGAVMLVIIVPSEKKQTNIFYVINVIESNVIQCNPM